MGIRRHDWVDHWAGHEPASDETSFTVVCRVDSITEWDVAMFDCLLCLSILLIAVGRTDEESDGLGQ